MYTLLKEHIKNTQLPFEEGNCFLKTFQGKKKFNTEMGKNPKRIK